MGLPRARGDRPPGGPTFLARVLAPPRPRGSTLGKTMAGAAEDGSPAPAGIDPASDYILALRPRLPRARGDRPKKRIPPPPDVTAPPRPRGSTGVRRQAVRLGRGSPAPAGIDPPPALIPDWRSRLPRARGDRPCAEGSPCACCAAPPRPRGSTRHLPGRQDIRRGSPAPAGIDPPMEGRKERVRRLPRARGDRPCLMTRPRTTLAAPPRPRGSTPARVVSALREAGSPAPAGIDPKGRPMTRARGDRPTIMNMMLRLPRARGDGGSPAPAGIDPGLERDERDLVRLPRARGDRPRRAGPGAPSCAAPPRPRGSTRRALRPNG